MFNFKKTLSVVLAVIMMFSALSVLAFAHTSTWTENPDTVNLKYEVEQVPSVTMRDGTGTYTAVNNDIYAVTVYAKTPALTGIMYLQVPFQYDVRYFEPVMTMDAGELYCAYDGWHTDIGITDVCVSLPERYTDTNSYDKDGNVTTSSLKIKCNGLGKVDGGLSVSTYYYGLDNEVSTNMKAYEGLDENIRVCALTLDGGSMVAKAAYLNAVNGLIPTDWVEMGTMYFHRVAGVSEADVVGKSIGIADGANFGTQLTTRTTTAAQPAGFLTAHTNPKYEANYVSNAVVASAAAESILKPMSSQIRFKGVGSDGDFTNYGGTFDVRTRATISTADFNAKFTDEATAIAGITDFGFVYAAQSNVASFDLETAKGVAQGTAAEGYVKKTCNYIQRTAEGYNFTCLIQGIADADHTDVVNCIAYICFNGEYIFFDAPATADYNALYTAHKK